MENIAEETERATDRRASGVLRNWAVVSGLTVVVLGVAVMVGWALNIQLLKQVAPSLVSMKFNTALCLALLGAGVAAGSHSLFARIVSLTAVTIAAVSLVESATGWSTGIDELIFRDAGGGTYPGRMAITTAVCLCLGGTALLARHAHRRRVATTLALALLAVAWLACLGYLFGVQALYRVSPFSTMAGHTAVACIILAVGLLSNNPGGLLPWIVRSDDPGATLLRIILPAAFIGLPLIAEVRLQMQHAGWFGTEFGLAVMVVVSSTALAFVSVIAARAIDRSHQDRLRANAALRGLNTTLESTVQERTDIIARSETWARALAGSAPIGIFRTDENGLITYVNERLCEIYDVSAAQLLDDPWDARCHRDDRRWVGERSGMPSRIPRGPRDTAMGDVSGSTETSARGRTTSMRRATRCGRWDLRTPPSMARSSKPTRRASWSSRGAWSWMRPWRQRASRDSRTRSSRVQAASPSSR